MKKITLNKRMSILVTGSEIVQGEIQDINGQYFAKCINEMHGQLFQHIQTSDNKREIISALRYLLNASDAVIVTGGLGPTSDDNTRFAIAEMTRSQLELNETAWQHVTQRLQRFNLSVTESNRQQALFPKNADLYPNENGTAYGCHLVWNNKHIFMLPGPPNECKPLFEKYVLPLLKEEKFFLDKKIYRWKTLGLIEGEIAPQVDAIIEQFSREIITSYRWNYPYLDIKFTVDAQVNCVDLLNNLNMLLLPNTVSTDGKNAMEALQEKASMLTQSLAIQDTVTGGQFETELLSDNFSFFIFTTQACPSGLFFTMTCSPDLFTQKNDTGSLTFNCCGFKEDQKFYAHTLTIPNRSKDASKYAIAYFAWQLTQFILRGD